MLTLKLNEFEAWLRTLPDDAGAGKAGRPDACPVASWLKSVFAGRVAVESCEHIIVNGWPLAVDKPLSRFIWRLDTWYRDGCWVSKETALDVIERVRQESDVHV